MCGDSTIAAGGAAPAGDGPAGQRGGSSMEAVKAVFPARQLPRRHCPDSPRLEELRESRILPETGERGVDAQEVRLLVAELERFGEPRERVVVVAVERVEAGGVVRRPGISRARFGPFHGAGDLVLTLLSESHVPSRGLEVTSCRGVRRVAPEKLLEFAHGFAIEAVAGQEGPEVVAGENVARLELEDLAVRGDRLVGPSLPLIRESQVGLDDDRRRSHLDGPLEFRDGLLQLPLLQQRGPAVVPFDSLVRRPFLPASDPDQESPERQRDQRRSHCASSRHQRTCFMTAGAGIRLPRSCWFVVPTTADDRGFESEVAGGVMTMTGIEAIPPPMVLDRVLELSVEARASPVAKSTAA